MAKPPPFTSIAQTATDPLTAAPAGIGSNSGKVDLALLLEPPAIADMLAAAFADQMTRKEELLAGFSRFQAKVGAGIADDDTQGRAGNLAKQMKDHAKLVDERRDAIKRPVLNAGRQIDAYAKNQIADPLTAAAAKIVSAMNLYANQKAAAEKARLAEEVRQRNEAARAAAEKAEREAQEAAALAGANVAPPTDEALDAAIKAEEDAIAAAERARRATPASTSRVRSDLGVTSSLRTTRKWELTSLMELVKAVAAGEQPINLLATNDAILNVMAKDKNQQNIPGVRFYDESNVTLR